MYKKDMRRHMLNERRKLDTPEVLALTEKISDNLIKFNLINEKCQVYYLFSPINNEPDIFYIYDIIKKFNKISKICFPKCDSKNFSMDFYAVKSLNELKPGYMDIKEPDSSICEKVTSENGIMFLPGTVFDVYGNRIGYGGGYYDRYLSQNKIKHKVAICFDFQIMDDISEYAGEHDVKADYIISDKRIIYCNKTDNRGDYYESL